ncbi:MAG: hypothetical protein DIZ80_12555 [endosymbiont of Galathealinum brachiosum]|uniref:Uncharacterized protein n=1 Tax=endosymbiont of Galathealinum brachiosum TaxID=2200906 RepID=A0A370DE04_9GAMM|nr:MAG: hypothetical protein DIZ80_12555 [endosymbiont of Galathealinum brachiosum]
MSVIDKLAGLVEKLYNETADYSENPSDAQLWYNRGYANGVVAYFIKNGFVEKLSTLTLDAPDIYQGEQIMEWHKAYHHGFEMGERESGEVHQK